MGWLSNECRLLTGMSTGEPACLTGCGDIAPSTFLHTRACARRQVWRCARSVRYSARVCQLLSRSVHRCRGVRGVGPVNRTNCGIGVLARCGTGVDCRRKRSQVWRHVHADLTDCACPPRQGHLCWRWHARVRMCMANRYRPEYGSPRA